MAFVLLVVACLVYLPVMWAANHRKEDNNNVSDEFVAWTIKNWKEANEG